MIDSTSRWSRIIGLDLSKQTFVGCILSGEEFTRKKIFHGTMTQDEEGYLFLLDVIHAGDIVVMEAGSSTFTLARFLMMRTEGVEIVVLNPSDLRVIWDTMKKTDKADATKLAKFIRDTNPENWPTVTVPTAQEQAERGIISLYTFMQQEITRFFNRLFAVFNSVGYPEIDRARMKEDTDYRNECVENFLACSPYALMAGRMTCMNLDLLLAQKNDLDEELRAICYDHPKEAITWLSMPGIGLVNAATLVAFIGDGSRFSKAKQVVNYAGLCPKVDQSGESALHGKITKRGCKYIRRSLVQGAHSLTRMNVACPLTKFAYRKTKELKHPGKVAVASATQILKTGLYLLHHDDIYIGSKTEEGKKKLKRKIEYEYKLKALTSYLPQ